MKFLPVFLLTTSFFCLVTAPVFAKNPAFLSAPFWDDGKAEVNVYAAKRLHYGRLNTSTIKHFLVKEGFSKQEMVKSDHSKGENIIPVIKLNQTISTPTGTYDYQQMHSSFWEQRSGNLLKFSMSHHEACGASYKTGVLNGTHLNISGSTYWQGQSKISTQVPVDSTIWLYDNLPLKARILVADGKKAPAPLKLIPSSLHSRAGSFSPFPAKVKVDGHTVTLTHAGGKEVLVFDSQWPHVLKSWKQADGESLTLKKTIRLPYWNHHNPGDEKLLE